MPRSQPHWAPGPRPVMPMATVAGPEPAAWHFNPNQARHASAKNTNKTNKTIRTHITNIYNSSKLNNNMLTAHESLHNT